MLADSAFFGMFLTLACYQAGVLVKKKVKVALATPLLVAVVLIIGILLVFHIDYAAYENGAKYISYFLTPATVSLAIPLYRRLALLKEHPDCRGCADGHDRYFPHEPCLWPES